MRVYVSTKTGRRVVSGRGEDSNEEMQALQYVVGGGKGGVTGDEAESQGYGRWMMKKLKKGNLIMELTG